MKEILKKTKNFLYKNRRDLQVSFLFVLIGMFSFALGRISVLEEMGEGSISFKEAIMIPFSNEAVKEVASAVSSGTTYQTPTIVSGGALVASKNGGKYHLPWCSGAQRIKEENKIYFESKEEAESAGYTPAANCKGL